MSVIEFNNVSKSYQLGASRTNLRDALARASAKLIHPRADKVDPGLFWALNDVSFKVEQGEVLGIIGHNGAGKSTALKLLSKVTFPSSGSIHTSGRMAALIELGAGFHPDLSGRENIYLNGSILGLKRREIDAQFDSIVDFAGLQQFIDTPVKRYSSGMYVRLAFATAAHVKADLLLIDEVLSVGDSAFQQKCLAKMREMRDNGATIVFVSHNIWSVETFCQRVILLRGGRIESEGTPSSVIELYRRQQREMMMASSKEAAKQIAAPSQSVTSEEAAITSVEILDENGQPCEHFEPIDSMRIRVHYYVPQLIERSAFQIEIRRADGLVCCDFYNPSEKVEAIQGKGFVESYVKSLMLAPDIYTIGVRIDDRRQPLTYAFGGGATFHVKGYIGDDNNKGVFQPDVEWEVPISESRKV